MADKDKGGLFLLIFRAYANTGFSPKEEDKLLQASIGQFSPKSNKNVEAVFGMAGRRGCVTLYRGSLDELHTDVMKTTSIRLGDFDIIPLVSESQMTAGVSASLASQAAV